VGCGYGRRAGDGPWGGGGGGAECFCSQRWYLGTKLHGTTLQKTFSAVRILLLQCLSHNTGWTTKNRGSFHGRGNPCLFVTEPRPCLRPTTGSCGFSCQYVQLTNHNHLQRSSQMRATTPPIPPLLCPARSFPKHQE